jgi:hypothetical protein
LHNTLGSTDIPKFKKRNPPNKQDSAKSSAKISTVQYHDFEGSLRSTFSTPDSSFAQGKTLSELGDSSSLFSYDSPTSVDFGPRPSEPRVACPISCVLGAGKAKDIKNGKMVNERSPAKVPLNPVVPNDQPPKPLEGVKPLSSAPLFGQTSLPQSQLFRAPPKEKSVFVQPKSRPEHHRDTVSLPHVQALKETGHRIIDPLMPRAPAAYA